MTLSVNDIASICHEANRAYRMRIGQTPALGWEEVSEEQRESCVAGVQMLLERPESTPEQMHQAWMDYKIAQGWVYGPVKSEGLKTHPCIRPYAELPEEDRIKDAIFKSIVDTLRPTAV